MDSNVGRCGEFDYTASNWEQLLKRSFSTEAIQKPVILVVNSASDDTSSLCRHAEGFSIGKGGSLLQVVQKLAYFASTGKGRVTLSERGASAKLKNAKSGLSITPTDLLHARGEILKSLRFLRAGNEDSAPPVEGSAGGTRPSTQHHLARPPILATPHPDLLALPNIV